MAEPWLSGCRSQEQGRGIASFGCGEFAGLCPAENLLASHCGEFAGRPFRRVIETLIKNQKAPSFPNASVGNPVACV